MTSKSFLLDMYPKEMDSLPCKYIFIFMFTEALFTREKIWKQLKCPPVHQTIDKETIVHLLKWDSNMGGQTFIFNLIRYAVIYLPMNFLEGCNLKHFLRFLTWLISTY